MFKEVWHSWSPARGQWFRRQQFFKKNGALGGGWAQCPIRVPGEGSLWVRSGEAVYDFAAMERWVVEHCVAGRAVLRTEGWGTFAFHSETFSDALGEGGGNGGRPSGRQRTLTSEPPHGGGQGSGGCYRFPRAARPFLCVRMMDPRIKPSVFSHPRFLILRTVMWRPHATGLPPSRLPPARDHRLLSGLRDRGLVAHAPADVLRFLEESAEQEACPPSRWTASIGTAQMAKGGGRANGSLNNIWRGTCFLLYF